MVEGIIGFSDMLSIAQTIGIVGTVVLTLIFSKRHIRSLSSHQQIVFSMTYEKVRKMIEIIIENHQSKKSSINLKNHQMS
jgi:F0F1-type ATP synthase membrane subunit a